METETSSDIFGDDSGENSSDGSDPFHVSEPSLPEISFARSTTFPSLQGGSASTSENGDHDDYSDSSQGTEGQLPEKTPATRQGFSISADPPSEILYIQMVGRTIQHIFYCPVNVFALCPGICGEADFARGMNLRL